jgi:hypothetical protein
MSTLTLTPRVAGILAGAGHSRSVSVDVANTASSDNTVDTDGKALEAKRNLSPRHDNVITSNATLENNVPAPAFRLGGIDSGTTVACRRSRCYLAGV